MLSEPLTVATLLKQANNSASTEDKNAVYPSSIISIMHFLTAISHYSVIKLAKNNPDNTRFSLVYSNVA